MNKRKLSSQLSESIVGKKIYYSPFIELLSDYGKEKEGYVSKVELDVLNKVIVIHLSKSTKKFKLSYKDAEKLLNDGIVEEGDVKIRYDVAKEEVDEEEEEDDINYDRWKFLKHIEFDSLRDALKDEYIRDIYENQSSIDDKQTIIDYFTLDEEDLSKEDYDDQLLTQLSLMSEDQVKNIGESKDWDEDKIKRAILKTRKIKDSLLIKSYPSDFIYRKFMGEEDEEDEIESYSFSSRKKEYGGGHQITKYNKDTGEKITYIVPKKLTEYARNNTIDAFRKLDEDEEEFISDYSNEDNRIWVGKKNKNGLYPLLLMKPGQPTVTIDEFYTMPEATRKLTEWVNLNIFQNIKSGEINTAEEMGESIAEDHNANHESFEDYVRKWYKGFGDEEEETIVSVYREGTINSVHEVMYTDEARELFSKYPLQITDIAWKHLSISGSKFPNYSEWRDLPQFLVDAAWGAVTEKIADEKGIEL